MRKFIKGVGKADNSPSQSQYSSIRKDFSERNVQFSQNMHSTMMDLSQVGEKRNHERCEECRNKKKYQ